MTQSPVHVGVELGGTKIVVGASASGAVLMHRQVIATGAPEPTLASVRRSVARLMEGHDVLAIGVASFGPVDLRPHSETYGQIMATPKPAWSGVDVLSSITVDGVATTIDTDVNAAVLAERRWGAASSDNVAYLTVGTGIGGAIWSGGGVIRGANHSEVGHLRVPRHPDDDFIGICPFHGVCLEGMASGTAMQERWGKPADDLGEETASALELEAWYLAHAVATLCAAVPVEQVIIGGGVSKMPGLHSAISSALPIASGGYPFVPFAENGPQILAPGLGDDAGVIGAIELGRIVASE